MEFTKSLVKGKLIKRYKRFFTDVKLGKEVGLAYQSPRPLYFNKATSCENVVAEINKNNTINFFKIGI